MMLKIILTFLASWLLSGAIIGQQLEKTIPADALKEDLRFLQKKLENKHPNLYLYTQKIQIDHIFDSLFNDIKSPMTELAFYHHISIISSWIKDGHTILLPSQKTMDLHNKQSKFLPYKCSIIKNKLYIDLICTTDTSLAAGDEITAINNTPTSEILSQLMVRQIRDGENLTYPNWILHQYFKSYYSFHFGHPGKFNIEYQRQGIKKTALVNALPNDSISYYRKLKYPDRDNTKITGDGITLQTATDQQYAILTIKDFHNDVLRKEYHQRFPSVIDEYFREIKDKQIKNLVIDLRNNQGGDIENGVTLLSYLVNHPFSVVEKYLEVDGSAGNYQLRNTNGPSKGLHDPAENIFNGSLYVLINGGSFSNSGIVAAALKKYKRAVFVGEETGGNNMVLAGFSKAFELPNSQLQIEIPTKQFLLDASLPLSGRGTLPDFPIEKSLSKDDPALQFILKKIRQQ
jgi:hypothetical protein